MFCLYIQWPLTCSHKNRSLLIINKLPYKKNQPNPRYWNICLPLRIPSDFSDFVAPLSACWGSILLLQPKSTWPSPWYLVLVTGTREQMIRISVDTWIPCLSWSSNGYIAPDYSQSLLVKSKSKAAP